ncbi:extracellular solute-binding protein [Glycomyces algeriensis]|uniref:Sugar ABC transporter substrate-binding protein n=1 Tax=Glycomyces algeriensis TaxID=256037 RepID=A0A9W6G5D0_9ACTN|nr:extracellular solute-binding protein [Glycomyces algeriensis]MDA1367622.1 extracellular solute-binding protein [Glycomyces algeriensis]MDR7353015.1 putative aldouronate transport system substrate-binding protein [Glycomyces algeriensis]GLI40705.1 sugar ABC transporter substrate-binding protein [Glycomyces algeriensis]
MAELSRRKLLGVAGAAAAATALGSTAACSGTAGGGAAGGAYDMPTFQPAPELDVQPHYASETPGMESVYTEYPNSYFKSVERGPGSGGKVTSFQLTWGDPATPLEENTYWQELNERLGVSFEPQFVPQPVFDQKFATMLASGDVPDLVFVNDQSAGNLQGIRDGAFADLSETLSGDNILKWPNLAARKEEIWQASLKDGRIYQVPSTVWALTNLPTMRTDLVDQTSVGRAPKDADELFTMLKEVSALGTGPGGQKVYGLNKYDAHPGTASMFQRLFKTGPEWQRNGDGDLVHITQTENYRAMLEWLARAWAEGIFDPVAMSPTATDIVSGAALRYDSVGGSIGATGLSQWEADLPGAKYDFFDMPGFDGSGQLVVRNVPYGRSTCVSAAAAEDEDRLTEILNVLDYLSAPFGSEEQYFIMNGTEGVHHTVDAHGIPIVNPDNMIDLAVQYVGVTSGDNSYRFHPNAAPWADSFVAVMESMAQNSIARDLEGLEAASQTFVTKGAQLKQLWTDFETGVITGRESIDDLQSFADNYMSQGGTQVRDEYTQALKDAGK